jgi:serine/threonine protein kinase
MSKNYNKFNWQNKIQTLFDIISGIKEIHQKRMVHRDFHTGNILFKHDGIMKNNAYISDMGLCGEVDNIDETSVYGIMSYVAPEVLRRDLYTQAADIYSFGMIMYFVAAARQPFDNRVQDHRLAIDICKGIRPKMNEPEAPKCYIDLMEKCWDSNPANRPNATEISVQITSWTSLELYSQHFKGAEEYRKANLSSFENNRLNANPQITSRLLNPFTIDLLKHDNIDNDRSDCLDCEITD